MYLVILWNAVIIKSCRNEKNILCLSHKRALWWIWYGRTNHLHNMAYWQWRVRKSWKYMKIVVHAFWGSKDHILGYITVLLQCYLQGNRVYKWLHLDVCWKALVGTAIAAFISLPPTPISFFCLWKRYATKPHNQVGIVHVGHKLHT